MKKYKLKKDLPTFKAGQEFAIAECNGGLWLIDGYDEHGDWYGAVMAYAKQTLEKFPNILEDWFEEIPEEAKTVFDLKDGDYRPSPEVKAEQVWKILYPRDARDKSILEGLKDIISDALASAVSYFKPPEEEPEIWFIDDDPKNVEAVCRAYPFIQGIIFGTKRIRVENE